MDFNSATGSTKIKKKKIPLEEELITTTRELRDKNNEFQVNAMQILTFSKDYESQRGEKLPKCITIGEGGFTCNCMICRIDIPTTIYNISRHINGTKHEKAMLDFVESQILEVKDMKKSTSEPVPLLNYRTTEEIATCFKEALNIGLNNIQSGSAAHEDKKVDRKIESLGYFRIAGYNITRCTLCCVEVPNNYSSIVTHLNSRKHEKSMRSGMELPNCTNMSKNGTRSSALTDTRTPTSEPVLRLRNRGSDAATNVRDTNKIGMIKMIAKDGETNVKQNTIEFLEFPDRKIELQYTKRSVLTRPNGTKSFYKCPTCLLLIPNDKNSINRHNNRKRHQRKVKLLNIRVTNELYFSQNNLLDCISIEKNRYFCRICDKLVPEDILVIDHLNGRKHKINIKTKAVTKDPNKDGLSVLLPKYTKTTKVELKYKINVQKSVNGNGSNRYSKLTANIKRPKTKANFKYKANASGKEETKSIWQEKLRDARDHFVCDICFKSVPNCKDDINHHMKGEKHRSKMLLGAAEVSGLSDLFGKNYRKRRTADSNDKKLQIGIELPDRSSIRGNGLAKCTLCVSKFPNNPRDIDLHVNGKRHKGAVAVDTKLIPDVISVVKNGKRSCTLCLIRFANNCNSINYHTLSKKHQKAMLQLSHGKELQCTSTKASQKSSRTTAMPMAQRRDRRVVRGNFRTPLLTRAVHSKVPLPDCISIKDDKIAKCSLCGTKVPNNPHDLDSHLNGRRHKEAIKVKTDFVLDFSSFVKNGKRYCVLCRSEFQNNSTCLLTHIASEQHKNATSKFHNK